MREEMRGRSAPDAGFTLIELVVSLLILGVLVAMVVPSYSSIQNGVREAATQSDLGNDRTALVAYGIDNNGVVPASTGFDPKAGGSNLIGYGWQQSEETTSYHYYTNSDRTGWCLEMTNVTGAVFRISQNKPTAQSTCAALGVANY